jgi:hypothetical protein
MYDPDTGELYQVRLIYSELAQEQEQAEAELQALRALLPEEGINQY